MPSYSGFGKGGNSNRGFTLIEVMVVIVIAALMVGILVFGFDQTLNRRKSAAAEEVYQWLQAAADTAVFQSTIVGVTEKDDQLMLLAFYQDDWYKLADQEALAVSEEISFSWSESLLANNKSVSRELDLNRDRLTPYVVILPSGEITPEGEMYIFDQSLNDDSFRASQQALASILWNQDEGFKLAWNTSE